MVTVRVIGSFANEDRFNGLQLGALFMEASTDLCEPRPVKGYLNSFDLNNHVKLVFELTDAAVVTESFFEFLSVGFG